MSAARLLLLLGLASCEKASDRAPPTPPPPPPPIASIDLVLALDLSKSMEETDLLPDRLQATQDALRAFVAASPHDRVGLVVYALRTRRVAPVTADHAAIARALGELRIGDVPELGTAIGDGLAEAVDELRVTAATRKAVVLLGDGDNNVATRFAPAQAAAEAAKAGVTVHTILVGTAETTVFLVAPDPATFQQIASTTGGSFHRATDVASLAASLREIRAQLDASARAP